MRAVVLVWMIHSLVLYIAPDIPAKLDQPSYAVATVHAAVGVTGFAFGMFVVLRGNELVAARDRLNARQIQTFHARRVRALHAGRPDGYHPVHRRLRGVEASGGHTRPENGGS